MCFRHHGLGQAEHESDLTHYLCVLYQAAASANSSSARVMKLVDTGDSKFSSDFVSQVEIKLFCGVPVKGFAGSIKKDCRQTINVFSARVVKLVDTGDKRKPVSLKN